MTSQHLAITCVKWIPPYGNTHVVILRPIVVRSVNGPTCTTIIGGGRCAFVTNGAVLAGFTLRDGHAQDGGGAMCWDGGVLSNCIITGNSVYGSGGGVQGGTLYSCTIAGNQANYESFGYPPDNTGPWTGGWGGGVNSSKLFNCVVTGNVARYSVHLWPGAVVFGQGGCGGGAAFSDLFNCLVAGNSCYAEYEPAQGGLVMSCGQGGGTLQLHSTIVQSIRTRPPYLEG